MHVFRSGGHAEPVRIPDDRVREAGAETVCDPPAVHRGRAVRVALPRVPALLHQSGERAGGVPSGEAEAESHQGGGLGAVRNCRRLFYSFLDLTVSSRVYRTNDLCTSVNKDIISEERGRFY